jgi:threonine dehydrogenase-like Zn-dependent dehydrogenase
MKANRMTSARALWIVAEGAAELRSETLPVPGRDSVLLRTLFSGISRGTERLVFHGNVPEGEWQRMRAPLMGGAFPFPVKYGYSAVGVVEAGPAEWLGRTVFALAPHQDRQIVPLSLLAEVPAEVPPRRAVLAANMETALNAVWDSGAGPGDAITVVGAGIVGLLIARICALIPGTEVTVVDPLAAREAVTSPLGAVFSQDLPHTGVADIVFHTSATESGLRTALEAAAFEGTVVEVSWYGEKSVTVPLGGAFHSQRLKLISSQVGHVAASRRPRWDYARRRAKALALLADERLDGLLTEEIAFSTAAEALPRIFAPGAPGLQTVIRY